MTQLQAKQIDKQSGCPTPGIPLLLIEKSCVLDQLSPTFLAPETGFVEDYFPIDPGVVWG